MVNTKLPMALGIAATLIVATFTGCSTDPDPTVAPRRQANAFLDGVEAVDVDGLCSIMSRPLLERLAPPAGECGEALRVLTMLTGSGDSNQFLTKRVDEVTVKGDTAVVTLEDRITGDTSLPMKLVKVDDTWLVDDFGSSAELARACLEEREAVAVAVEEYLAGRDRYPADVAELVPGQLPEVPANHVLGPDGEVVAAGRCA